MKKEELRIVYMGTPEFAVESLRALVEGGYNVVGVITMPDKPMGRHGSVLQSSPVKLYAESVGLPLLQPEKLKDETFLEALRAWNADLQIVVAFRMLPEVVWNMPPLGTFNLHASLLPKYRGAAPINWAIIKGEDVTGVTTFFLTHEIDTGKVILRKPLAIRSYDDAGIVHDRLMSLGAGLVIETVDLFLEGAVKAKRQRASSTVLFSAPKLFKDTCRINWEEPRMRIYDFIRGLSPYPTAWTELVSPDGEKRVLKIYKAKWRWLKKQTHPVGTILSDGRTYIDVAVFNGRIRLLSIQLAGKKRMDVADFLNGFKYIERYTVV